MRIASSFGTSVSDPQRPSASKNASRSFESRRMKSGPWIMPRMLCAARSSRFAANVIAA